MKCIGLLTFFLQQHYIQWSSNLNSGLICLMKTTNASVNSTCAQYPHPRLLRGICLPYQSWGWGICKFCTAQGPGICQPLGHSRAFDTHAVFYQNITTQKVLLEKKRNWSYWCESTFFGYWIKFLLTLFEEHPFIFIKLFIPYNCTALY